MPKKNNLYSFWGGRLKKGVCVHGHFNRLRGTGVSDYYPEVDQFITFLREPFEIAVSNFFFIKKLGKKAWRDGKPHPFSAPEADIHDFFKGNKKSYLLNFFPFELTWENYKETIEQYFVYVGIMEYLQQSMDNLALRLGFPKINVGKLNVSPRFEKLPPDVRARFKENNALEYAVYDYAIELNNSMKN